LVWANIEVLIPSLFIIDTVQHQPFKKNLVPVTQSTSIVLKLVMARCNGCNGKDQMQMAAKSSLDINGGTWFTSSWLNAMTSKASVSIYEYQLVGG
jgi:hypothetical protein